MKIRQSVLCPKCECDELVPTFKPEYNDPNDGILRIGTGITLHPKGFICTECNCKFDKASAKYEDILEG